MSLILSILSISIVAMITLIGLAITTSLTNISVTKSKWEELN